MHGGVLAVEQSRLGEEEDARTGGADHGATLVHSTQPVDERGIASLLPPFRWQQHRRNDHDVGRIDGVDRALHVDVDATREIHRS